MHAALIIDEERLTHEHAMLRRLCIGLIDQGVRVTRIVPEEIDSERAEESEQRIALANRIRTPMRGGWRSLAPWLRRSQAERIAETMESQPSGLPDVVYAVGRGAWTAALDLAEVMDRPAAINVWSAKLIKHVPRVRRFPRVAAYIAASAPIAEQLGKRVDPVLVSLVPMGAPLPKEPRRILEKHPDSVFLAVLGSCEDTAAYDAMLAGMAKIGREGPVRREAMHIAIDMRGRGSHEVWRIARRYDLLGCIASLDDASQHRELLAQCDVMLLPERSGELTSLLLEAMAGAAAVIARDDPFLDVIKDGETGLVVRHDDAAEWADRLRMLLADTDLARKIGLAGRELVGRSHGSAQQARRLAETLESVVGPDTTRYRFQQRVSQH